MVEELGVNFKVKDWKLFGVVEFVVLKDYIGVLEYFLKLDSLDFEVWKNFICGLLVSDLEILCVKVLVEFMSEGNFDYLELFLNVGGV